MPSQPHLVVHQRQAIGIHSIRGKAGIVHAPPAHVTDLLQGIKGVGGAIRSGLQLLVARAATQHSHDAAATALLRLLPPAELPPIVQPSLTLALRSSMALMSSSLMSMLMSRRLFRPPTRLGSGRI